MTKVQAWLSAFRLRTLPLALSSIIMGSFIAAFNHTFSWIILALASLTTLFLQILSNLANDYGDTVNGADHEERQGPQRMVQAGLISPKSMLRGIVILALLALVSGVCLIYYSFSGFDNYKFLVFLGVGIAAIIAAMKYTMGKNPYGYRGLGDLFVLLFFGVIGVGGSYFLHSLHFQWDVLLPALAVGFLSAGVLNLNNMRDIESDRQARKNTLVVLLGLSWAKKYHYFLVVGSVFLIVAFLVINQGTIVNYLGLIAIPLFIRHIKVVIHASAATDFDPELKRLALSTFIFVLLFGIGLIMI